MKQLSVDHLTGIVDLTRQDIELILETAARFKEVINRPIKKVPSLRDITIANVFFENSTRTRLSFELAQKRLSADVVNFSAASSSVKKGETLVDTVNNILAMKVDMVVMRHPNPGAAKFLSQKIKARVVNAGDGTHEHPTQALLDAFSIQEKLGTVAGKKVVIVGDILHSRVALSNIYCLQKLGAEVMVCGPSTLIPKYIEQLGVKVSLIRTPADKQKHGLVGVKLMRKSGDIEIVRRVPDVATLIQPTQPTREISLPRRSLRDCLSEDLRRLDPDDLFGKVIKTFGPHSAKPVLTEGH